MKIIDKIVTSNIPPQQLNVVWHNTATNELKIWGNNGWELVGGNPNASSGGYPVVTVENDFNIEAQPNTFYNIKNSPDNEVNINFKDEEFGGQWDKMPIFYFDATNWNDEQSETLGEVLRYLTFGGVFVPSNVDTDFKYEFIIRNDSLTSFSPMIPQIFVSEIPSTNPQNMSQNIKVKVVMDAQVVYEGLLPPICIINKDIDYIVHFSFPLAESIFITLPGVVTQDLGYDGLGCKYQLVTSPMICGGVECCCIGYTEVEYKKADKITIELSDGSTSEIVEFPMIVESNKEPVTIDEVKEFVFNLKSPANIVFSHPVSWNNSNTPDFTQSGTYTLSILNGVGCYTFI